MKLAFLINLKIISISPSSNPTFSVSLISTKRKENMNYHPILDVIKSLHPYAHNLCKNYDDALDLIQDVNLLTLRNLDKIPDDPGKYTNWVMTVFKNSFINKIRFKQRRIQILPENFIPAKHPSTCNHATIDDREALRAIGGHIRNLNPRHRDIYMMAVEGYKYEEIAQAMDMPLGTVKCAIHVCRNKMIQFAKENSLR